MKVTYARNPMNPNARFLGLGSHSAPYWSAVKMISQEAGYTVRNEKRIKVPSSVEMDLALKLNGIRADWLDTGIGERGTMRSLLAEYFQYRATVLDKTVQPLLMDAPDAKSLYEKICSRIKNPTCPLPQNKQKGDKKGPNFLTCMVNLLIEEALKGLECSYDPRSLATITHEGVPVFTLSRRMDGAFPSTINPIALWEIKEYYYTTTFGSRVADGIYETLLDGMEIEMSTSGSGPSAPVEGGVRLPKPLHYLIVDSHYTWWECGRSYLCRIIDLLHMGHIDAVIFGRAVESELAPLVAIWVREHARRMAQTSARK